MNNMETLRKVGNTVEVVGEAPVTKYTKEETEKYITEVTEQIAQLQKRLTDLQNIKKQF
jgi:hypothetical protein